MPLTATALLLAAAHRHAAVRVLGIVLIIIGGFTFTFRRALVARNPGAAPAYTRTVGPLMSAAFVVAGLVLIVLG